MDTISYMLGKKAGGGTPTVLEEKDVTVTSNGESIINPSEGYNGTDINVTNYASANVSVKYAPRVISFSYYSGTDLNYEISNLDTSNITTFENLFHSCSNITTLDLSSFNTSNVTSITSLCSQCANLQSINLSGFSAPNVENINTMFNGCVKLTSIDLSDLNPINLTQAYRTFYNCTSLTRIDIRKLDFTNTTSHSGTFGTSASNGPPDNCLIIVKDQEAKTWMNTNFSRLTNVKTVAEYEGS